MIKIYHNPRCRKSREGLAVLEESGKEFEIIKYLDQPLSTSELEVIIEKLEIQPIDLVRKNEKIWKESFKGNTLSDKEIVNAMVTHPKLIESPIVIHKNKGVIGRPVDNILELI